MRVFIILVFIGLFLFPMSVGCRNPFDTKNTTSSITGRITDRQGNALSNAKVYTDPPTTMEITKGDGSYVITNVSANSYQLKVSKPGYVASTDTVVVKDSPYACESGTIYRDVRMAVYMDTQLGSMSGRVVGANGTAIDSVTITMTTGEPYNYITSTDTDGKYKIAKIVPGNYTITAVKYGYDTVVKSCVVKYGESANTDFELSVSSGVFVITTVADNISADGIAIDSSGNIYYSGGWNDHKIYKISASGIITTIAGTGEWGYSGDGGLAMYAKLYAPIGIAIDNSDNIYFADSGNSVIRKIDTTGIITTIAGTGDSGYSGDDGPAISAKLYYPEEIIIDNSGNIYFTSNIYNVGRSAYRVRKMDTTGIITTIAGTDDAGYSGDEGPAISAIIYDPVGITVDNSGNIYLADYPISSIRKIDNSGIITTIAGTGEWGYSGDGGLAIYAKLYGPRGIAIDNSGNIYITGYDHRVRKIDTSGIITTIAGTGLQGYRGDERPAIYANFDTPNEIIIDNAGNIYLFDKGNKRIAKISKSH